MRKAPPRAQQGRFDQFPEGAEFTLGKLKIAAQALKGVIGESDLSSPDAE